MHPVNEKQVVPVAILLHNGVQTIHLQRILPLLQMQKSLLTNPPLRLSQMKIPMLSSETLIPSS